MRGRRLPLIVAAAALVVALLVLFLLVMPKRSEVAAEKEALTTAEQQQAQLELQLQQLTELKQQAQQTRRELDKIDTQIPKTSDQPGLIRLMQLATDKAGVDMTTQTYGNPTAATSYSAIPVSLAITGNFFQLDQFLYQLETLPRLMKVTSITIASAADYPILTLTLTGESYTSDISSGPGGQPGNQSATTTTSTTSTTTGTT